ncbi:DNA-binding protein [Marinoscillum sp. 108]|uniref:HU family DNA-binding protein n=1 Tax=Marinoscillum sp. 108 TaxID=2653151 RepID=UPI0012F433F1|nr:DNA-binding protein [Marinoscillum sp. 108]VXD11628.1 putative DNA-binding protein [Marinoscillum sp. 108]
MALKFSVVARKNPSDPNAPFKYYPQPVTSGESGFKSMARKIQKNTGQNYADVIGVLAALEDLLPDEIKNGNIIRLGDIGSFYPRYKSVPSERAEDVTSRNIEHVNIMFRSNKEFLEQLNTTLAFEKVDAGSVKAADEEVPEETES